MSKLKLNKPRLDTVYNAPSILHSIHHSYSRQHAIVTAAHLHIETPASPITNCSNNNWLLYRRMCNANY